MQSPLGHMQSPPGPMQNRLGKVRWNCVGGRSNSQSSSTRNLEGNKPLPFELTREVRITLEPEGIGRGGLSTGRNSWAYQPASRSMLPNLSVRLTVAGTVDGVGGYLCDIRILDGMVKEGLAAWYSEEHPSLPWTLWTFELNRWLQKKTDHLPSNCRLQGVEVMANPQLCFRIQIPDPTIMEITRQFEFSASHRLHAPGLTDEANRAMFGKCNRPNGHGHNYVLAVTIRKNEEDCRSGGDDLAWLDHIVREKVIDRLDHWNLNHDVAEFRELNPTVENIAIVVRGWLQEILKPGEFCRLRLYETPKTWVDLQA
jgi:6-pyruvoyltetrahydropterin/6-carboxytetrahydropterin synthase